MSIQYTADQLQHKFPDAPGSPGFARLAEVMRAEGRLDEAIQLCQEGLRARPYQLSGYLVLGKCLLDGGRLEEAREQFTAALNLDPRCLSALHHLALIMGGLNRHENAVGFYRSILAVEPWDEKAKSLLREASAAAGASPSHAGSETQRAPAPVRDEEALGAAAASNAIEFDLNSVADFLPAEPGDPASGLEEISLADALSAPADDDAVSAPPHSGSEAMKADVPEPTPMDILRDDAADASMDPGPASDKPPISGQDVEDRLDSLFGLADDTGALPASASGGWKAAPAASAAADVAGGEDAPPKPAASRFSDPGDATLFLPEAKAPAAGETGVFPPGTFSDETPISAPSLRDGGEVAGSGRETSAYNESDLLAAEDRVSGEDIEKRLDDLFNLGPEASAPIAVPEKAPEIEAAPSLPEAKKTDAEDIVLAPEFGNTTQFQSPGDLVTGQDVADKLEDLFGAESGRNDGADRPSAEAPAVAAVEPKDEELSGWQETPPSGNILSTESMLPSSLAEGPAPVTGADIEDRLDQLFNLEEDAAPQSAAPAKAEAEDVFAFQAPPPDAGDEGTGAMVALELPPEEAPRGEDAVAQNRFAPHDDDRTVLMPALKEPPADWLTHQDEPPAEEPAAPEPAQAAPAARVEEPATPENEPAEDARETMMIASDEAAAKETGGFPSFGAADTAAVEMVQGSDVADRLDEMFKDEGAEAFQTARTEQDALVEEPPAFLGEDPEMLLPPMEASLPDFGSAETVVSGEDVSARLSELFQAQPPSSDAIESEPVMEVPLFLERETAEPESAPLRAREGAIADQKPASAAVPKVPELAPMQDEEEGYPEEEEMQAASSAAGANVATVTLAEIYFQQGLREQALQIYRQLLEREPGNDSVRKRIQEIEACKPDDDKGGEDPRRPRPGLKVPKRKK